MSCIQCGDCSKYKCPTCLEPYCSVKCYKLHKETPCQRPPSPVKDITITKEQPEYEYPTEDTVPLEKLKLLEHSTELKKCLENPHVREMLTTLDTSTHPEMLIQEYMQEPIFTEFVDECLKVVQPYENNKT